MRPYEVVLLGMTILVCAGTILMLLRTVWAELRSSLYILTRTKTALEEIEIRLERLDEIPGQIECDTRNEQSPGEADGYVYEAGRGYVYRPRGAR
ncbi:hypothetical protein [Stappia sp. TSB10P1A]|uniref:hypothetical protein n=1 Tax=Stappia sp. TSB10P1A TaxID=2003585 RepID=UPI0016437E0C|nr:hypothetical protein [Stappia sp. TSB10P1A]